MLTQHTAASHSLQLIISITVMLSTIQTCCRCCLQTIDFAMKPDIAAPGTLYSSAPDQAMLHSLAQAW
jgi:hypothetical protein